MAGEHGSRRLHRRVHRGRVGAGHRLSGDLKCLGTLGLPVLASGAAAPDGIALAELNGRSMIVFARTRDGYVSQAPGQATVRLDRV